SSTGTLRNSAVTKLRTLASSPLQILSAKAHAARQFQRAPPEAFGLGVTTETLERSRSGQSLMFFGLPLRTRNTIVEVYGELFSGRRFCQSGLISLRSAIESMS